MRLILSVIALMIPLSLSGAPLPVEPEDTMLAPIYEMSQAPLILRYSTQKRDMLKAMGQAMASPAAESLDNLLEGVLTESNMDRIARQYFAKHWDFAKATKAVSQMEPYVRLLQLEAAAGAPEAKKSFRMYFQNPDPSVTEERVLLLSELDELTFATEWMSALLDVLVSAMDTKLVPLVASQKISQQDYEASLQALRQQAAEYRESRPGTWLLLYAYRDIPIAELKKYRDALETDEGRWFMRTSRHAVIEAMRSSMERFADNLVRVL